MQRNRITSCSDTLLCSSQLSLTEEEVSCRTEACSQKRKHFVNLQMEPLEGFVKFSCCVVGGGFPPKGNLMRPLANQCFLTYQTGDFEEDNCNYIPFPMKTYRRTFHNSSWMVFPNTQFERFSIKWYDISPELIDLSYLCQKALWMKDIKKLNIIITINTFM